VRTIIKRDKVVKAGTALFFCSKCGKALKYAEWLHGRLCDECHKKRDEEKAKKTEEE